MTKKSAKQLIPVKEIDDIVVNETECNHPGRLQTIYDRSTRTYETRCRHCGARIAR